MSDAAKYTLPALRERAGDLLVKVRAQPGSAREGIAGVLGDALKIAVTAAPERGKANAAVEKVLAAALGVRPGQVRIHSGAAARDKWVRIEGLELREAARRIEGSLRGAAGKAGRREPDGEAQRKDGPRSKELG